jgi:hypothetical protein
MYKTTTTLLVFIFTLLFVNIISAQKSKQEKIKIAMAMALSLENDTQAVQKVCPCSMSGTCPCDETQCPAGCVSNNLYRWVKTNNYNQTALYKGNSQIGNWWHEEQEFKRLVGNSWVKDTCPVDNIPDRPIYPTVPTTFLRNKYVAPVQSYNFVPSYQYRSINRSRSSCVGSN